MDSNELDKALRNFEKKHPIKKPLKHIVSLDKFVSNIEKQLDKIEYQER